MRTLHITGRAVTLFLIALLVPSAATAQSLGTFRWQLLPYCNVVTATVAQHDGVFTLDGYDDQCGAGQRAAVAGTAFPNPDGSFGVGLTIITAPAGIPVHVEVALDLASISGPWRDSTGASGTFAFNPGAASGSPRPVPNPSAFPTLIAGQTTFRPDGGFVARGTADVGTVPASGPGVRAMWFPAQRAFRAGQVTSDRWDTGEIGRYSVAFGLNPKASGHASAAFGDFSEARGVASFAAGQNTSARASYSTALNTGNIASGVATLATGSLTLASGHASATFGQETSTSGDMALAGGLDSHANSQASIAFGRNASANGLASIALGTNVLAAGNHSVALGRAVSATPTATGTFIFGDASETFTTVQTPNSFIARAHGGFDFITASTPIYQGCQIAAPAGRLSCTGGVAGSSDRTRKQDIEPLNGDDVLAKVAALPVTTWSFIDTPGVRHAGPMAQDFHAAFGLGDGDTTINYTDINGINMRAIQALEARTRATRDLLADENRALRQALAALEQRVHQLERPPAAQVTLDLGVLAVRERAWRAWFAADATYLRSILAWHLDTR